VSHIVVNILIVLALIVVEGMFVAAEIALVSLRESQVKAIADRGRRGAAVARLVANPNRFLAAVQLGVTLTALLSSAYGAVTLSENAKNALVRRGMSDGWAGFVGIVGVTLIISFVTLVLGELAPKRLALQRAEGTARAAAPFLDRMATIVRPVIWLLSKTTDLVVRLLGGDPTANREAITEEELRDLVEAHETLGPEERQLISDVFEAGDRQLHEVMVPRTEVDFLDASTPVFKAVQDLRSSPHSRYPVVRGSADDVVGFVHVRDLLDPDVARRSVRVGDLCREVRMMPGTKRVLAALSEMRREGHHLAIVVDEYGGTDGIVTLEDLVEEVIGEIHDEYDAAPEQAKRLRGGDVEVDGLLNLDDFEDVTGIELPEGPYETLAGFVVTALGRLPEPGDVVEALGHRFTVTELDGRRAARVRVSRVTTDGAVPAT